MPPPSSANTSGASTVPHQYFTKNDIFRNINCSVHKACKKYRKQTLAVVFVLLEMISIILDIFGTNTWDFSLASFVLSAFGVVMTLYGAFFIEKGIWNRLTAVEIVFSFTQMIVAYIDLVVKIIRIKINYNYKASAFPLGFAIIVLVYAFKSNEKSPPTEPTSTDPVESPASRKWSDLPGERTQAKVADSDLPGPSISIDENPKTDGFDGVSKDNLVDKQDGLKKRKTVAKSTEIVKNVIPIEGADDGYSWRKYGQKDIEGAKHPRGYYRCTHRHAQGCLATKQVQRSDEDPSIFEVTYRRRHTCSQNSQLAVAVMASSSVPPAAAMSKEKRNHQHYLIKQQEHEVQNQKQSQELMMFGFRSAAGLKVKTEDLDNREDIFPSFSFPLTSIEADNVEDNMFIESFTLLWPQFVKPHQAQN